MRQHTLTEGLLTLLAALFVAGCAAIGPSTIPRDRFDYNSAIADSWKEQTLLNIVKLRYADMPLFVEVVSVVSGYSLESTVNLGGTVSSTDIVGDSFSLGTAGKFTDRPTITYAPITGQRFNKSFMTPIPPRAILFLIQSGWAVDLILPITVESINGLRSRFAAGVRRHSGDSEFYRAVSLLRDIQNSGAVSMQILQVGETRQETLLQFHQDDNSPELRALQTELDGLLGLDPRRTEFSVVYGLLARDDTEVALLTRSMLQIMIALAVEVSVPPERVAEGRTIPVLADATGPDRKLIDIRYSIEKPEFAFTAVRYRDHWFWIDDRDFSSKRTFAFLMVLFSLTETGGREGLPLVTIPAN